MALASSQPFADRPARSEIKGRMPVKKKLLLGCGGILLVAVLGLVTFFYLLFHRTRGEYFDSNGVQIHYVVEGHGKPVILVHGLAANADINWRRPGITRRLAKDFQVVTFDLRGHGLSGQPADPAQYGAELAEDVVRLMDHLKIPKASLAGYSLGGFIALKVAALHPDRVCSVAVCAAGWKNPDDPSPIPNPYKKYKKEKKIAPQQAGVLGLPSPSALVEKVRHWAGERISNGAATRACRDSFRELAITKAQLESIKIPTICFIGTNDGLKPMADDLQANMPNLEFKGIEGANHLTTPFYGEFKRGLQKFLLDHPCSAEPQMK